MNKPLVYYVISLIIGSFCFLVFDANIFLGIILTVLFLSVILFTVNKQFYIFIFIFFLIGAFNSYTYFNISLNKFSNASIRVIKKRNYDIIGTCYGRKFILNGCIKDIEEGERINIYASYKPDPDYANGIVGSLDIHSYNKYKDDYISKSYKFKHLLYNNLIDNLGKEKAAIVISLCFGDSEYLSKSQWDEFKRLGVVHAISVSGMHMGIIYSALERVFGFAVAIIISFLYVIFTGAKASTIRAFIMIIILNFSKKFYQNYDAISSLSLAAIILLLKKPYYFLNLGFALSFLATLGIILYYKKLKVMMYKLPTKINEAISLSISAQFFSMPYSAFYFNSFSPGFILGNIFLIPIYSLIIIFGNIALIVLNFENIFKLISYILNIFVTAVTGANYLLLKIAPREIFLSRLNCIVIISIYFSYILYKNGYKKFKYIPIILFTFILLENYSIVPQITYFNLGNGDSVLFRYKFENVLISNYNDANGILKLKDSVYINKINAGYEYKYKVNTGKGRQISAFKYKESNEQYIDIIVKYNKKNILFTRKENLACINNGKTNYDIINIPSINVWKINDRESASYIIIFGKTIKSN